MKIIGTTEVRQSQYHADKAYVVIVTEGELKKVADKAGYRDEFPKLNVGDDYELSAGWDFRAQLTTAVKAMEEAYTKFAAIAPVAAEFAGIVRAKAERGDTP